MFIVSLLPLRGFEPSRRANRFSGAIRGEKAMSARREWLDRGWGFGVLEGAEPAGSVEA